MTDTTYEEAKRCPKCDQPGELRSDLPDKQGGRLHTFVCKTTTCKWYDQVSRVVSINPDGSVPTPTGHRKRFPTLPPRSDEDQERINAAMLNATLEGRETR